MVRGPGPGVEWMVLEIPRSGVWGGMASSAMSLDEWGWVDGIVMSDEGSRCCSIENRRMRGHWKEWGHRLNWG